MITTFLVINFTSIAIAENLVKYYEMEDPRGHVDYFIDADSISASHSGIEYINIRKARFPQGGAMVLIDRVIADCPGMRGTIVRAQVSKDDGAFQDIQIPGGTFVTNYPVKNEKVNDAFKYVCNKGVSLK